MMKKATAALLLSALLAGCAVPAEPVSIPEAPTPTAAVPVEPVPTPAEPTPTATPEPDWTEILTHLQPEDMQNLLADGPEPPAAEAAAPLIREAIRHPIERQRPINNNDSLWFLTFSLKGEERELWLHFYAGLEENIVLLSLPEGELWLEDEALYWHIRTANDTEKIINTFWYEKYRDMVDRYFNERLETDPAGYASWELTEFVGLMGTSKEEGKGITVFQIGAAFSTDPSELVIPHLAGGVYLDSDLRVHGGHPVRLVTIDGEAIGILTGSTFLDHYDDDPLSHYTEEEIREMVANAQ